MRLLKMFAFTALSSLLLIYTASISFTLHAEESTPISIARNVETWVGQNTGYIKGYQITVGATMTYNGSWGSRGWIISSGYPGATICLTIPNPSTSSVAVFVDFNGDGLYEGSINVSVEAI